MGMTPFHSRLSPLRLVLALLLVWLAGCRQAVNTRGDDMASVAVVELDGGPSVVLVHKIKMNAGAYGFRVYWRLDRHSLSTGERAASWLWPPFANQTVRCYAGDAAQLWCMEGDPPNLVLRDAKDLGIVEDRDQLADRIEQLREGISSLDPRSVGVVVRTAKGDSLVLGDGEPRAADPQDAQRRPPAPTAIDVPAGELSFVGPADDGTLSLILIPRSGEGRQPMGLRGVSQPSFLSDARTGKVVRFEDERLTIVTHRVGEPGAYTLALVGLGFDGQPRWTTEIPEGTVEAVVELGDTMVLVVSGPQTGYLMSVRTGDGQIEWTQDI